MKFFRRLTAPISNWIGKFQFIGQWKGRKQKGVIFEVLDDPEVALDSRAIRAIGRITVQMAALELDLMRFLSTLLFRSPNTGIPVFIGVNLKTLIGMLLPTFRLKVKTKAYDDDIVSLVSALEKLADERNSIIHGQWHYDAIDQRTFRAKTKRAKRSDKANLYFLQTEQTSARALNQFADIVFLARHALTKFYKRLLRDTAIK